VSHYRFIEVEKVNHAVRTLCRVLQVSRAAYYHWSIHLLVCARECRPRAYRAHRIYPCAQQADLRRARACTPNCTSVVSCMDANAWRGSGAAPASQVASCFREGNGCYSPGHRSWRSMTQWPPVYIVETADLPGARAVRFGGRSWDDGSPPS